MNLTAIDKQTAKVLGEELQKLIAQWAESHGLTATVRGGTYDPLMFKPRLELKVIHAADGKSGEQAEFESVCRLYALEPSDYGRTFNTFNGPYKLVALKLSATRMPIVGERFDGKRFKFPQSVLRQWGKGGNDAAL